MGKMLLVLIGLCVLPKMVSANAYEEKWIILQGAVEREMRAHPAEKCAMVFFTDGVPLEEVRSALDREPLTVKGFRHGSRSGAGGYMLKSGETLDEAVLNYRRDHEAFLDERIRIEEEVMAAEMNDAVRNAMAEHRAESERMKDEYRNEGIRIVSMELCGEARNIYAFVDRRSPARVTALKDAGK